MTRVPTRTLVAVATLLAPTFAWSQANSIMRSFHPEKYENKPAGESAKPAPDRDGKPADEAATKKDGVPHSGE